MEQQNHKHHFHILPTKVALTVATSLLILTAVTVWAAHIDMGRFNFIVALIIATVKALLVIFFFMGLLYDHRENRMIFLTSFIFLAIFLGLTSADLFFRGDVYLKGPLGGAQVQAASKLKKPWVSTPQLVAHGKELFMVNCVSCHGADGKGDGPAATALNPRPRNFTSNEGWVNGRKVTMVFKTLKEGVPPSAMPSFVTLPADDRWALVHYVLSLGPTPAAADTSADFAKIGIDPNKEGGGATEAPTISIELAMQQMQVAESSAEANAHVYHPVAESMEKPTTLAGQLYQTNCVQCHGVKGQGGIKVKNLGVNPVAFVTTAPFKASSDGLKSQESFNQTVIQGLPGRLMPGYGHLSTSELRELYQYVKGFAGK